eukprot:gene14353-biopygen23113
MSCGIDAIRGLCGMDGGGCDAWTVRDNKDEWAVRDTLGGWDVWVVWGVSDAW